MAIGAWTPASDCAAALTPIRRPKEDRGGFLSPERQRSQTQALNEQVNRLEALQKAVEGSAAQIQEAAFTRLPSYPASLPAGADLTTFFQIENSGSAAEELTLEISIQPLVSDQQIFRDTNGSGLVTPLDALLIINRLNAVGGGPVTPEAALLDVNRDGSISPLDALMVINWLNRQGIFPYSRTVFAGPGTTLFPVSVSGGLLRSEPGLGQHAVTFSVRRRDGSLVGNPFMNNPLTIGTVALAFDHRPDHPTSVLPGESFSAAFEVLHTGDAPASAFLQAFFYPLTSGSEPSLPVQIHQEVILRPGNNRFNLTIPDVSAAGLRPGQYSVDFQVIGPGGIPVGRTTDPNQAGFTGSILDVGTVLPGFAELPSHPASIGVGDLLPVHWRLENAGDAPASVTLITSITPVLGEDRSTRELSTTVQVNPGGRTVSFDLSGDRLREAGLLGGTYSAAFAVRDARGEIVNSFFGSPLQIGTANPVFEVPPTFTDTISPGTDLDLFWTLSNSGDAPVELLLTAAVTPLSGPDQTTREFSESIVSGPGQGNFQPKITAQQLADSGIVKGVYVITFSVATATGRRIGSPISRFLEMTGGEVFPATPFGFFLSQTSDSDQNSGLIKGWQAGVNDPLALSLRDRCFTYDQAVSAAALANAGMFPQARTILDALVSLQESSGLIPFGFKAGPFGQGVPSAFTGADAWAGSALVFYEQALGDTRFRQAAVRLADGLRALRDPATGLLFGGRDASGNPLGFISTEHNVDAYFFLKGLAGLTGESRFSDSAEEIAAGLQTHLWAGDHFRQGFNDNGIVLDAQTLGALFLLDRGQQAQARTVRTFIDAQFRRTAAVNGMMVSGFAPYSNETFIWIEGTLMTGFLDRRLGDSGLADQIAGDMERFRFPSGGIGYASTRSQAQTPGFEGTLFPELPNAASTAWGLLQASPPGGFLQPMLPPAPLAAGTASLPAQSRRPALRQRITRRRIPARSSLSGE